MDEAAAKRTKPRWRRVLQVLGIGLVAISLLGLLAFWFFPDETERAAGRVVQEARQVTYAVASGPPTVHLGPESYGMAAVDAATDGTWIEMAGYREDTALQPTYASHNTYGGDIVLEWEIGQEVVVVHVDGSEEVMRVTDSVVVNQEGTTTEDLRGLAGSILLQSCYYDFSTMRVVALTPLGEAPLLMTEDGGAPEDIIAPDPR